MRQAARFAAGFAGLALILIASSARADESTLCTDITSVPFTISAPGVYCLKTSLSFSGSFNAIAVGAPDVVIDLNGNVLDGTPTGPSSNAIGVMAYNNRNVTVRNGTIRGFRDGINLGGSTCNSAEGYRVENVRLEHNVWHGAMVQGRASIVRGNSVFDTGNGTGPTGSSGNPRGLWVCGDGVTITDNQVIDTVEVAGATAHGIIVPGTIGATVERNVVSNSAYGPSSSVGIQLSGSRNNVVGNRVVNMISGIQFSGSGMYMDNIVAGAKVPYSGGTAAGTTNFSY